MAQVPAKPDGNDMNWGNSGVYFLSNYELQIIESHNHQIYADGISGAIYGQTPPLVNAWRKPGEWERLRRGLHGRRDSRGTSSCGLPTSRCSGTACWCRTTRPRCVPPGTKGVKINYDPHSTTVPITLQYHNSAVRFRNIWVRPLKAGE